eukprot:scaffold510_cov155-Amphora_coffeaeformis.AAC.8
MTLTSSGSMAKTDDASYSGDGGFGARAPGGSGRLLLLVVSFWNIIMVVLVGSDEDDVDEAALSDTLSSV